MFSPLKPLPPGVRLRPGRWIDDVVAIARVRRTVFIEEQAVPEAMEWETIDAECDWFVALDGGDLVGIARLTPQGRIGRMAVLKNWRGKGIGSALLSLTIEQAKSRHLAQVELHAQSHAIGFYERFGFTADGAEFDEAGIPHRHMVLNLRKG